MVKLQRGDHYAVGWAAEAAGGPAELARARGGVRIGPPLPISLFRGQQSLDRTKLCATPD
jgi:hypothetical protein